MDAEDSEYCATYANELNADLVPRPDLCVTCRRDEWSGEEVILCNLTRLDQQGEPEFCCDAYESKEGQSAS